MMATNEKTCCRSVLSAVWVGATFFNALVYSAETPKTNSLPDEYTPDPGERTHLWQHGELALKSWSSLNPHIVHEPESEYPFKMWYYAWKGWGVDANPGYPGCDANFFARSKDLKDWQVWGGKHHWVSWDKLDLWEPVTTIPDMPSFYNNHDNGDPSVVRHNGRYYMVYSAAGWNIGGKEYGKKFIICVMAAESDDGINWTKSKEPILIWNPQIGKMTRRKFPGPGPYYGGYACPSLMRDQERWKVWFQYGMDFDLGYAENSGDFLDPNSWDILNKDDRPQLHAWPNPDITKVDNVYYGYTEVNLNEHGWEWVSRGGREAPWLFCEAVSENGKDWQVLGWIRPREGIHHYQVPEAFSIRENGQTWIYLFYSVPVAGKDPYDFRNRYIHYMKRPVDPAKDLALAKSMKIRSANP